MRCIFGDVRKQEKNVLHNGDTLLFCEKEVFHQLYLFGSESKKGYLGHIWSPYSIQPNKFHGLSLSTRCEKKTDHHQVVPDTKTKTKSQEATLKY